MFKLQRMNMQGPNGRMQGAGSLKMKLKQGPKQ